LQELLSPDEDSYDSHDKTDSSSDEGDNAMTGGFVILCFWFIVGISNGYLVYMAYKYRGRRRLLRRVQDEEESNRDDPHFIAKKLAGMTTDAKIDYYNNLFDKQGNQRTVVEEHIIMVEPEEGGSKKGHHDIALAQNAIEKDIESCDDSIESEREAVDTDDYLPLTYLSPSIIPTCEINDESEGNSSSRTMHAIDGQCAICLETYQPGDLVVYNMHTSGINKDTSEDEEFRAEICNRGCYHVYHKACLVQYLANRKISQKALKDGQADTPSCPTCRAPYVQLLPIGKDTKGQIDTEQETEASQVSIIESDDETPTNGVHAAQARESSSDRDPESQLPS